MREQWSKNNSSQNFKPLSTIMSNDIIIHRPLTSRNREIKTMPISPSQFREKVIEPLDSQSKKEPYPVISFTAPSRSLTMRACTMPLCKIQHTPTQDKKSLESENYHPHQENENPIPSTAVPPFPKKPPNLTQMSKWGNELALTRPLHHVQRKLEHNRQIKETAGKPSNSTNKRDEGNDLPFLRR